MTKTVQQAQWKVAGASVRGFSHEAEDRPCEDHHAVVARADGWLLAISADGAGSARHGGRGSELATAKIVEVLDRLLDRKVLLAPRRRLSSTLAQRWIVEAITQARQTLGDEAKSLGAEISDFHATLVGCLVGPRGGGLFFQIGDGAACAQNPDCLSEFVLSLPENGEYAESTYFLTEDRWESHLRFTDIPPAYTQIALMSDGVTGLALTGGATPAPFGPFLEPVTRFLRDSTRPEGERGLAATLASEQVRTITGDDKTFVWALRDDANG